LDQTRENGGTVAGPPDSSRREFNLRHFLFAATGIVLATCLTLIAVEFGLGRVYPQETLDRLYETNPIVFERSEYLPFKLPSSYVSTHQTEEYSVRYTCNAQGFRDPDEYAQVAGPGIFRYLAMGDSFTFGNGVADNETWPNVLEALMRDDSGSKVEVMNAAYACSFSPDAYALYYRREGRKFGARVVLVAVFVYNDIDDIRNNDWFDVGPDGFPGRIKSRVTYIDTEGRRLREETYPLRYRLPILRNSHVFQLLANSGVGKVLGLSRGYRDPGYTGQVFQRDFPPELKEAWEWFKLSFEVIKEDVTKDNAELLVVLIPSIMQLVPENKELRSRYSRVEQDRFDPEEPNRKIRTLMKDLGIEFIDLLPFFRQTSEDPEDRTHELYYWVDGHLTPKGQALTANIIADHLHNRASGK